MTNEGLAYARTRCAGGRAHLLGGVLWPDAESGVYRQRLGRAAPVLLQQGIALLYYQPTGLRSQALGCSGVTWHGNAARKSYGAAGQAGNRVEFLPCI